MPNSSPVAIPGKTGANRGASLLSGKNQYEREWKKGGGGDKTSPILHSTGSTLRPGEKSGRNLLLFLWATAVRVERGEKGGRKDVSLGFHHCRFDFSDAGCGGVKNSLDWNLISF